MASRIPDSRFGRAMKAGIPVALVLLGAELIDGSWRLNRSGEGLSLSWTRKGDSRIAHFLGQETPPTFLIKTCLGRGCARASVIVSLPRHHLGIDMASVARSVMGLITGDGPDQGKSSRPLAMA
jgi:hypothetical protein